MADESPASGDVTPIAPAKSRPDGAYSPAVPSPLNPESARRPVAKPVPREQREKKESLKKREMAAGGGAVPRPSSDQKIAVSKPTSKVSTKNGVGATPAPQRYPLQTPSIQSYQPPVSHTWASHEPTPFMTPDGRTELKRAMDCAQNTKVYKYTLATADPLFPHKQWYRGTEAAPYGPQFSAEDSDKLIHFNEAKRICTNERGWRTSRANVFAREGSHYYEVRIAKGVPSDGPAVPAGSEMIPQPHVRMGWTRREAPLDAPVGFDGYSYGITDIRFQTIHKSRPGKITAPTTGKPAKGKSKTKSALNAAAAANQRPTKIDDDSGDEEHVREGDVIGMLITLPSLSLQKKVAEGIYNPAVDVGDGFDAEDAHALPHDVIRDRIPVHHRGNYYFEHVDYQVSKSMEVYGDRGPNNTVRPSANHEDPALRCLPHSSVKIWKNGILCGTAFENLMSFLPPASEMPKGQTVPTASGGKGGVSVDDGTLGYYPAVSSFAGGIAEINFGPDFWFPPTELKAPRSTAPGEDTEMTDGDDVPKQPLISGLGSIPAASDLTHERQAADKRQLRALSQRYPEQIAEDIIWDIVDEASFFAEDGGYDYKPPRESARGSKNGLVGDPTALTNGNTNNSTFAKEESPE